MNHQTKQLIDSITQGLKILQPYVDRLDVDPVNEQFELNSNYKPCSKVRLDVVLSGTDEPTEKEMEDLAVLGWVYNWPYVSLNVPQIYKVPTREQYRKRKKV